jgi:hypothetical protein
MEPESAFLRFGREFYVNPIAELGGYIRGVSEDVTRLSNELSEMD